MERGQASPHRMHDLESDAFLCLLCSSTEEVASPMERGQARTDAWSTRMREKYGLDTSNFSYNPDRANGEAEGPSSHPIRQDSLPQQRRCAIM